MSEAAAAALVGRLAMSLAEAKLNEAGAVTHPRVTVKEINRKSHHLSVENDLISVVFFTKEILPLYQHTVLI